MGMHNAWQSGIAPRRHTPSPIRTLPSAPGFHRIVLHGVACWLAGFHRRSGLGRHHSPASPHPEGCAAASIAEKRAAGQPRRPHGANHTCVQGTRGRHDRRRLVPALICTKSRIATLQDVADVSCDQGIFQSADDQEERYSSVRDGSSAVLLSGWSQTLIREEVEQSLEHATCWDRAWMCLEKRRSINCAGELSPYA